jgi:Na+-transporting NADH:ubiquinone oxidoreductase subunit NqrB
MEQSFVGELLRDSVWMFPVIEAVHLIGLAILGGSILIGDLRLLGFVLNARPINYVINETLRWLKLGLFILVSTGIPLFLSEAIKCYYSRAFWIKMSALMLGLIFLFFIRNPLCLKTEKDSFRFRLVGIVSISIWAIVAGSGRWIGFS